MHHADVVHCGPPPKPVLSPLIELAIADAQDRVISWDGRESAESSLSCDTKAKNTHGTGWRPVVVYVRRLSVKDAEKPSEQ